MSGPVSLDYGDGSPAGSTAFGDTSTHTYAAAGSYGIHASTADGQHGNTRVTGPGDFDIVVTENAVPGADPGITSLAPAAGVVDQLATVTVTGDGYVSGSTVEADGAALPTTFVDATHLTADITPTTAGTVQFTVRNPDDMESNGMAFAVTAT